MIWSVPPLRQHPLYSTLSADIPMRNIAIYGGTFDPPHRGHLAVADAVVRGGYADEVWCMVSPRNPLKLDADISPDTMRLDMTRLITQGHEGVKVSDFEFQLPIPSYTINTLQALEERYPDCRFRIVIGEDNLHSLHRWRAGYEIAARYGILCYPRHDSTNTSTPATTGATSSTTPGATLAATPQEPSLEASPLPEGVVIMDGVEYVDVSSTMIRRMAAEAESAIAKSGETGSTKASSVEQEIARLTSPSVAEYILTHNLYKQK